MLWLTFNFGFADLDLHQPLNYLQFREFIFMCAEARKDSGLVMPQGKYVLPLPSDRAHRSNVNTTHLVSKAMAQGTVLGVPETTIDGLGAVEDHEASAPIVR